MSGGYATGRERLRNRDVALSDSLDYSDKAFLIVQARDFAGDIPLDDPRVSPINAPLQGLAPCFIEVGALERMREEAFAFEARARAAGATTQLDLVAEMPHNPPLFAFYHRPAARALDSIASYIDAMLTGRSTAPSRKVRDESSVLFGIE